MNLTFSYFYTLPIILVCSFFWCCSRVDQANNYQVNLITSHKIDGVALDTGFIWTQARVANLPKPYNFSLMTLSQKFSQGDDVYFDLYQSTSSDDGEHWSKPEVIPSLKINKLENGYFRSMSDMTPQWHNATKSVLNIGKSFYYTDYSTPDRSKRDIAYAIFDPEVKSWSEFKVLKLPTKDHESLLMSAPVAGCVQWLEEENGEILLPISYRKLTETQAREVKREDYDVANNMNNNSLGGSVTIIRCKFDGTELKYLTHGDEIVLKEGRGLGEPSITYHDGEYFLTIRQDNTSYVTKGKDGLHFLPIKEWTFDDGSPLGSYNTQSHWVSNTSGLFLVYTRKGANNDHVFRHRAPLFMAEADPESLQVIKSTERIIVPEEGIAIGNFGVTSVSDKKAWVVTTEYYRGRSEPKDNEVYVAKIEWE